jgi:NADH-quinone oxidoreductase subunit G
MGANKYKVLQMPNETIDKVMGGRAPKLVMDIHAISGVNNPSIDLSDIQGPAHSGDFKEDPDQSLVIEK